MRESLQRGQRDVYRDFREVLEAAEQRQVQQNAGRQNESGRLSLKPFPQQEVHHRGSEQNSREPGSPGEIERVAADQKNRLSYRSRADLGKDHNAKQKHQTVEDSSKQHSSPALSKPFQIARHYCVFLVLSHRSPQ